MSSLEIAELTAKDHQFDWLRTAQAQELLAELTDPGNPGLVLEQPVQVIKGGILQGTFGIKEVVYSYAMWISAKSRVPIWSM